MSTQGSNNKISNTIEKLISKNIDRSFAVCDLNAIVQRYENWKLALPRVQPFYAVKCNNYPGILQLLADLGVGFDCATMYEIEAVVKANCLGKNIIFANPVKDAHHITYANSVGVSLTVFDSLAELEKCKKYCPNAKLLIRIKTYSKNASNFEGKFGCDPYNEAPTLLEVAKSVGLNVVGVTFHVGTACNDGATFRTAIELARYVFNVASKLGFHFDTLNIGGGFIAYTDATIFKIAKTINNTLDTYFPTDDVTIMAEPGRYFVSSPTVVATKVICGKPNRLGCDENELEYLYYVNNGVFGMFQAVIYGFPAPSMYAWKKTDGAPLYPCTIFGQTMAPVDIISTNAKLPKLDVGDWIIYEDTGAYSQCLEGEFHLLKRTPVYYINPTNTPGRAIPV